MKQYILAVYIICLFAAAFAACSSTNNTSDRCITDLDCSSHCNFSGTWAAGAKGASTNGGFCAGGSCYCCYALFDVDPNTGASSNGECLGCNDVGTNCDADINYACYSSEDVCLYDY